MHTKLFWGDVHIRWRHLHEVVLNQQSVETETRTVVEHALDLSLGVQKGLIAYDMVSDESRIYCIAYELMITISIIQNNPEEVSCQVQLLDR